MLTLFANVLTLTATCLQSSAPAHISCEQGLAVGGMLTSHPVPPRVAVRSRSILLLGKCLISQVLPHRSAQAASSACNRCIKLGAEVRLVCECLVQVFQRTEAGWTQGGKSRASVETRTESTYIGHCLEATRKRCQSYDDFWTGFADAQVLDSAASATRPHRCTESVRLADCQLNPPAVAAGTVIRS